MFSNILLASDGSPCALKAADAAVEMATRFGSRLTVLTVYHPSPIIVPDGMPMVYDIDQEIIDEIQDDILSDTCRVLQARGLPFQRCKECGNPADLIAEVAEKEKCDLVIVGSRGLSAAKSFLLGSVSDRVTHHLHCPVLIVR